MAEAMPAPTDDQLQSSPIFAHASFSAFVALSRAWRRALPRAVSKSASLRTAILSSKLTKTSSPCAGCCNERMAAMASAMKCMLHLPGSRIARPSGCSMLLWPYPAQSLPPPPRLSRARSRRIGGGRRRIVVRLPRKAQVNVSGLRSPCLYFGALFQNADPAKLAPVPPLPPRCRGWSHQGPWSIHPPFWWFEIRLRNFGRGGPGRKRLRCKVCEDGEGRLAGREGPTCDQDRRNRTIRRELLVRPLRYSVIRTMPSATRTTRQSVTYGAARAADWRKYSSGETRGVRGGGWSD